MQHPESARPRRAAHAARSVTAVGAAVVFAILSTGSIAAADELTGTDLTAAGPMFQVFGMPLAAALWLLAGVVAVAVGMIASRRPRPVRSSPITVAAAPVDGSRA